MKLNVLGTFKGQKEWLKCGRVQRVNKVKGSKKRSQRDNREHDYAWSWRPFKDYGFYSECKAESLKGFEQGVI